jgi:hypothetical protein
LQRSLAGGAGFFRGRSSTLESDGSDRLNRSSDGSVQSSISTASAHQPIPQLSPLVFDYTQLPKLPTDADGALIECGNELKVFLDTLKITGSQKMILFFTSQSIHSLSEWDELDEEERLEVLDLMKGNDIVVGDRKKMQKVKSSHIVGWRKELADRGFKIKRDSLVFDADSSLARMRVQGSGSDKTVFSDGVGAADLTASLRRYSADPVVVAATIKRDGGIISEEEYNQVVQAHIRLLQDSITITTRPQFG